MTAPTPPTWLDARNHDWERATLREAPRMATWPAAQPTLRQQLARWWYVIEFALAVAGAALVLGYAAGAVAVVTA